jgi:hypothetical protein
MLAYALLLGIIIVLTLALLRRQVPERIFVLPPYPSAPPPPRRRWPLLTGAVVLAMIFGAVLAISFRPSAPTTSTVPTPLRGYALPVLAPASGGR